MRYFLVVDISIRKCSARLDVSNHASLLTLFNFVFIVCDASGSRQRLIAQTSQLMERKNTEEDECLHKQIRPETGSASWLQRPLLSDFPELLLFFDTSHHLLHTYSLGCFSFLLVSPSISLELGALHNWTLPKIRTIAHRPKNSQWLQ